MKPVRVLAHRVVCDGHVCTMAVLDVRPDAEGRWRVAVTPFEGETEATVFHSGTVTVIGPIGTTEPPELVFS